MAKFPLTRVGYLVLGAKDVAESVRYYRNKLGLPTNQISDGLAFVDAGSISIMLSSESGKTPGDAEVVFAVEHVRIAHDALVAVGVSFFREPHRVSGDSWAASFRDPDEHILSVFGPE